MDADAPIRDSPTLESPSDQAYKQARKRAEMIQGLYIHLLVYAVFNAGLFALNWVTRGDDGSWWFPWPMIIWGVGLLVHILTVIFPVFSPEWADRHARKIISGQD